MKKWEKIETELTHSFDPFFEVRVDRVLTPNGQEATYRTIQAHNFCVIIPIDAEGKIYLVRQHRYPLDKYTLEFPKGSTDGEEPLEAAKRELEEEIGHSSTNWKKLGEIHPIISHSNSTGYGYLAEDIYKIENPRKDPLDKDSIQIEIYTKDEVIELIKSGEITDSPTVSFFFKWQLLNSKT